MSYCVKCGVQLEEGVKKCPLCNTPVILPDENAKKKDKYPDQETEKIIDHYTVKKRYKRVLEGISLFLFLAVLITGSVDIIQDHHLSWSRVPLLSLAYSWLIFCFPLLFYRKPLVIAVGEIISLTVFVAMLDYVRDNSFSWFFKVAWPIMLGLIIIVTALFFIVSRSKRKGVNIPAYIIGGAGAFCVVIEGTVSTAFSGNLHIVWSFFVFFPALFLAAALLYFHYRFKNLDNVKKFFHF